MYAQHALLNNLCHSLHVPLKPSSPQPPLLSCEEQKQHMPPLQTFPNCVLHHIHIVHVTIWNFCLIVKTTINEYAHCAYILKAIAKAKSTRRYAAKIINNVKRREKQCTMCSFCCSHDYIILINAYCAYWDRICYK